MNNAENSMNKDQTGILEHIKCCGKVRKGSQKEDGSTTFLEISAISVMLRNGRKGSKNVIPRN